MEPSPVRIVMTVFVALLSSGIDTGFSKGSVGAESNCVDIGSFKDSASSESGWSSLHAVIPNSEANTVAIFQFFNVSIFFFFALKRLLLYVMDSFVHFHHLICVRRFVARRQLFWRVMSIKFL